MPQRHGWPSDEDLVALMQEHRSFSAVAKSVGLRRESLRDYLSARPALGSRMREWIRTKLPPEEAAMNNTASKRNYMRRARETRPDYCGEPIRVGIDHLTPIIADGDSSWDNLTPACRSCNTAKRDKPLLEFLVARCS